MITVTDLFCGAGGSALGAHGVPGVRVVMAANHWQQAIDTHQENFPDTAHDCADISQARPERYPRTDILWASPECTNHSIAKGRRRATNQPDLMQLLGYRHRVVYLNSMHAPAMAAPRAPQSRDRMYVVFTREGNQEPDLSSALSCLCCPGDMSRRLPGDIRLGGLDRPLSLLLQPFGPPDRLELVEFVRSGLGVVEVNDDPPVAASSPHPGLDQLRGEGRVRVGDHRQQAVGDDAVGPVRDAPHEGVAKQAVAAVREGLDAVVGQPAFGHPRVGHVVHPERRGQGTGHGSSLTFTAPPWGVQDPWRSPPRYAPGVRLNRGAAQLCAHRPSYSETVRRSTRSTGDLCCSAQISGRRIRYYSGVVGTGQMEVRE